LDNIVLKFWEAKEQFLKKIIDTYSLPHTEETVYMSKEINHCLWQKLEQAIIPWERVTEDESYA